MGMILGTPGIEGDEKVIRGMGLGFRVVPLMDCIKVVL